MAAFEGFSNKPTVAENFVFELIQWQKGNNENSRIELFRLTGNMTASIEIVDAVRQKYKQHFDQLEKENLIEIERQQKMTIDKNETENKSRSEETREDSIRWDRNFGHILNDSIRNDTILPRFYGGRKQYEKFIDTYLDGVEGAKGTVKFEVLIDANGVVKEAKVLTNAGGDSFNRVVRITKRMPLWKPATVKGTPIDYWLPLSVSFK